MPSGVPYHLKLIEDTLGQDTTRQWRIAITLLAGSFNQSTLRRAGRRGYDAEDEITGAFELAGQIEQAMENTP